MFTDIINYLKAVAEIRSKCSPNFVSGEQLLLTHGQGYEGRARPKGQRKLQDKMCYMNSQRALILDGYDQQGFTYCEGMAMRKSMGIPCTHAWLVDKNRNVLDLTWSDPKDALYWGIEFEMRIVQEHMHSERVWGSLLFPDFGLPYIHNISIERWKR